MIIFKKTARVFLIIITVFTCLTVYTTASTPTQDQFNNPDNDNLKIYIVKQENGQGTMLEQPNRRMFWEYPLLSAGQTRTGKMYIKNETEQKLDFSLSMINLPYDNEQALLYITNLKIEVTSSNGELLYQGSYSNIVDRDGMNIEFPPLEPGNTEEFTITMSCPFNYTGNPENQTAAIEWKITAASEIDNDKPSNQTIALIFCVGLLCVAALAIIARLIGSKRG
jgi:hypothetical protein